MTAALVPASLAQWPPASYCITITCQHCRQYEVCQPVPGKQGLRAYWYCVNRCWSRARDAGETVVRAEPSA
ncbi:hypothetical protein D3C84_496140 [compost metagenome]